MEKNGHKNGRKKIGAPPADKARASELGQRLREISDKALASGTTRLSHDQIQRLISEVRGGELR